MSKKKKIKKTASESDEKRIKSRRDFLKTAWKGLGIVAGIELSALTVHYLSDKKLIETDENLFDIGIPDEFPPGSVTAFRQGKFYLIRMNDGGFMALSIKCSHLGCSIIWDEKLGQFICPCHSSKFDNNGEVINPPAPRALDYFKVENRNGRLSINLNKKSKRDAFNKSQITYF